MGSVPVNKISDHYELTCGICKETYKNPKVLPCLHSFCQNCLDSSIRPQDRTVECSECQLIVPVPAKGIEAFPLNFFINNMLTVLAVQNPSKCTNCEDSSQATARCLDCVENLCSNCVFAHKRIRQTKEHRILSFDEIQANEVKDIIRCPSFCSMHPREVLKYFCETCDEAICRDCAIYEHREHIYVDLREAVKKYRSSITALQDRTKRKIPVLRAAVDEVREVTYDLRERVEVVRNTIRDSIQRHIRALEEQERELIGQLEDISTSKEKVLNTQQQILELDLSNLLSSCEFTENVLRYGNEAEIMLVKPPIVSRLQNLNNHESQCEPEDNQVIDFISNDDELSKVIAKHGTVSTSNLFPMLSCAEGPGLSRGKVGHKSKFTIIAKDRNGEPCTTGGDLLSVKLHCPNGSPVTAEVVDNDDGTYTASFTPVSRGDHQITIYARGKPIQGNPFDLQVTSGIDCASIGPMLLKFTHNGCKSNDENYEPWGVATGPNGLYVVSDHHNHRIQVFDSKGQFLHQFGSRGKADGEIWYPAGVCIDKSGQIYVADHGNNRIQVFTHDGKFVRKFGSKGTGLGQLKGPCGLALDSEGRIIVAERDNNRVHVFDSEGQAIMLFGSYGDGEGKLNCPRHIAVDFHDNIFVSDSGNFRVQKFNCSGEFLVKFGEKGNSKGQFSCPAGVAVDSEGHLVVADLKNVNVQAFDSEGLFLMKVGEAADSKNGSVFGKPNGVAISGRGNVIVADRGHHCIQVF
ncbi:tripartite motif-containing protein 2-like isoform X1 [Acropora muricata]|uniref:tripartite motif-containing protein 2-like isoform X1 n=2 Tax=Acropora muricata TaxID=159855 RepID=UPI0034E4322C